MKPFDDYAKSLVDAFLKCIKEARLAGAAEYMTKLFGDENEVLLLVSRYNAYAKDEVRGIYSREEMRIQFNRLIVDMQATFNRLLSSHYGVKIASPSDIARMNTMMSTEVSPSISWQDTLNDLKRRCVLIVKSREASESLAEQAKKLYTSLASYESQKEFDETYDIKRSILVNYEQNVLIIETKVRESRSESLAEKYKKIVKITTESRIPEWESLKSAYSILRNAGFVSNDCESWFFSATGTEPEPDEALRIRAVQVIDRLVANLKERL